MNLQKDSPIDPIDFISKERWITVTAIGSIFTLFMVNKFREYIFDPLLLYMLPPESFENILTIKLDDIFPSPYEDGSIHFYNEKNENKKVYKLHFGLFFRETLIWIFMILILYILVIFLRFPDIKGGSKGGIL